MFEAVETQLCSFIFCISSTFLLRKPWADLRVSKFDWWFCGITHLQCENIVFDIFLQFKMLLLRQTLVRSTMGKLHICPHMQMIDLQF